MNYKDAKELILVNPSVSHWFVRFVHLLVFKRRIPVSLLILAALTPKDYRVRFISQKIFWFKRDFPKNALVGITCVTTNALNAYALALRFKKAGAHVVLGGPHVSALPDEALPYCDSVVIGEAESVWGQVIKDHEAGALKKTYLGEPLEDFFSPVYDYFLHLDLRILQRSGFSFSRGCKYHCDFCARLSGQPRYAKIEQVVGIFKRIKPVVVVPFISSFFPIAIDDNNIFSSPRYAKALFRAIAPLRISWTAASSIDIAFDDEALYLARKAGCHSLFIGFESLYPSRLQKTSVNNLATTKDYINAIKKIKSHRIMVTGAFILGLDYYTHRDYLRLLTFFFTTFFVSRFLWIALSILTPLPGAPLFDRFKQEGRIAGYDWGKYDALFTIIFKPKNMSIWAFKVWYCVMRVAAVICSSIGFYFLCIWFFPSRSFIILFLFVAWYVIWQASYRTHCKGYR